MSDFNEKPFSQILEENNMTNSDNKENSTEASGTPAPENTTTAEAVTPAAQDQLTAGPDQNTPAAPKKSEKRQKKIAKKNQRQVNKIIQTIQAKQKSSSEKFKANMERMKMAVGKEDFAALKAICTVYIPEKKDDKGNVVQEASNQLNYYALVKEVQNLIVMRREQRIKEGKRKRTTGRSSDRRAHKDSYRFLVKRGQEAVEKKEEVSTVKV